MPAVYRANFGADRDTSRTEVLSAVLDEVLTAARGDGVAEAILKRAGEPAIKAALRENTDRARALGIFGAPSFVVPVKPGAAGGDAFELFWGDDRLEDAIACAVRGGANQEPSQ